MWKLYEMQISESGRGFIEIHVPVITMAMSALQWQSLVAMIEIYWPTKPKIFTL